MGVVFKANDLKPLAEQRTFNIEYDYSSMLVGNVGAEEIFVQKKVNEHNASEEGKGDKWKETWINSRKAIYEPKFEMLLNKYLQKKNAIAGAENTTAKYKMLVHTTFVDTGFYAVAMAKPALVDINVKIVESANPENVLAQMFVKRIKGQTKGFGNLFQFAERIGESYAKSGKVIGKFMVKKII